MSDSDLSQIEGLQWLSNWRADNGESSFVVPFPTLRPVNIVFHGSHQFSYGHYGVHLGQEDRLTFLGAEQQKITGHFIDCRADSITFGRRLSARFSPSSARFLSIPQGVAHAFDGLENIFTINAYRLFLPDPADWLAGRTEWDPEADVINVPMNVVDEHIPSFKQNTHEASDAYFRIVADRQRAVIPDIDTEYPFTENVTLQDGSEVRLKLRRRLDAREEIPAWEAVDGIHGVGWAKHPVLPSGPHSGFIPLTDGRPFYIVDHGESRYTHDAYGLHLGQKDCLTFLGPDSQTVGLTLLDCRLGSPSYGIKRSLSFIPNAQRMLVIPNGVAHAFDGLDRVFTLNQPQIFFDDEAAYEPGHDVIDLPLHGPAPGFMVSEKPAPVEWYERLVLSQLDLLSQPPEHSTPVVLLTKDADGSPVRVALRRKRVAGVAN